MNNSKCWHYAEIDKRDKTNCINCHHWGGERCKDEALLREKYEDSAEFRARDREMRSNRGIRGLM